MVFFKRFLLRSSTEELCDVGKVASLPCPDRSGYVISEDLSNSRFCSAIFLKSLNYEFVSGGEAREGTRTCFSDAFAFSGYGSSK